MERIGCCRTIRAALFTHYAWKLMLCLIVVYCTLNHVMLQKKGILPQHSAKPKDFVTAREEDIWNNLFIVRNSMHKQPCPKKPPGLNGVLQANFDVVDDDWSGIEKSLPFVDKGGCWRPTTCSAWQKVAIIIPFRNRNEQLKILVSHLHPFLKKQLLDYCIYVVDQSDDKPFNRAKLFNVGYLEAQKLDNHSCLIFHDVDLLPLNDKNIYACSHDPRHMSSALDQFRYNLPYTTLFGGAIAIPVEQFRKVNGFSNKFFGWGGEDDNMYERLGSFGINITRWPMHISRYTMIKHKKQVPSNYKRWANELTKSEETLEDGFKNCRYTLIEVKRQKLFTHIVAHL